MVLVPQKPQQIFYFIMFLTRWEIYKSTIITTNVTEQLNTKIGSWYSRLALPLNHLSLVWIWWIAEDVSGSCTKNGAHVCQLSAHCKNLDEAHFSEQETHGLHSTSSANWTSVAAHKGVHQLHVNVSPVCLYIILWHQNPDDRIHPSKLKRCMSYRNSFNAKNRNCSRTKPLTLISQGESLWPAPEVWDDGDTKSGHCQGKQSWVCDACRWRKR